jgi:hypothetical protein
VSRTLRWLVYCFALFVMARASAFAQNGTCQLELEDLETKGYVVGDVRFDTPLSFVGAVHSRLLEIQATLPVQKGKPFHCSDYETGMDQLAFLFGSGSIHPGELFRLALVLPQLMPCDPCAVPPTVDIVYRIYTSDPAYYASRVFEADHTSLTRRLAPPGMLPEQGSIKPFPYLGFNHARNLLVGSRLSYSATSGLFSSVDADLSGSKDSATASLFLSGSRKFQQTWVNYLTWRLGYKYENIPGDQLRVKSGTAVLSLLGASRAMGALGTIVRFGSAIEGGNQQARTVGGTVTQGNAYGSVKGYTGGTFNLGRKAFAGSYGIQFGSSSPQPSWDYTKQVANLSYNTRLLFAEHKPTAIDVQLGGGYISGNAASIPLSERFFGGNVQRNFIEGDSWHLPRNPLLRSFPEQDFGQGLQNGGLGGTNYYSANLTVAQAIWCRPIVPAGLSEDPSFRRKLGGQVALARESAKLSYLAETPAFQQILLQVDSVVPLLGDAQNKSTEVRKILGSGPADTDASASLDDLDKAIHDAKDSIESAKTSRTTALGKIRFLAVGFPTKGGVDDCNQLDQLQSLLTLIFCKSQEVKDELGGRSGANKVEDLVGVTQRLRDLKPKLMVSYTSLKAQAFLEPSVSQPLTAKLNDVTLILNEMLQAAQTLQGDLSTHLSQVDTLTADLLEASGGAKGGQNLESITSVGDWLATGFGKLTPPFLQTIREDVEAVASVVTQPELADLLHKLRDQKDRLATLEDDLRKEMESLKRPEVEVRAIRDTQFTGRLLDVIFRELNLYAVSPFALVDVVRLGGTHSPEFQTNRYAAGGGVRLSLVNFNVDVGYGFNVNRQRGERVGALYFSMNISDLFR